MDPVKFGLVADVLEVARVSIERPATKRLGVER
jgi:hypothetical protein